MTRGRLFVVSGPSGVGKGTLVRRVLALRPGIVYCPSYTTRPPRPGEIEGGVYRFVSDDAFDRLIAEGAFLEWVEVFGHRSGTLAAPVEDAVGRGLDVVKEMDIRGAAMVRQRFGDAVLVFVAPPSMDELERRLRSRGTESEEAMQRRLATALHEMAQKDRFDHVVVNDDLRRAAAQVAAIIAGYRRDRHEETKRP